MSSRFRLRRGAAAFVAAACLAGLTASAQQELVMEPLKDAGLNVYPAFEGWYQNEDGSYNLLVGYYNRNKKQLLDIPIGPENRIEPGGPDYGQPTHFLVGRGWGTFVIRVPRDFGDKKMVWTLTANGKTVTTPLGLQKGYQIEPFKDAAMGNTPPVLKFDVNGKPQQGPPAPLAAAFPVSGTAGEPVALTVWITDDGHDESLPPIGGAAPPPAAPAAGAGGRGGAGAAGGGGGAPFQRPRMSVVMSKYRGPGTIAFVDNTPTIEKDGKATTDATFSAPGEYFVRVEGNDASGVGGGGFQCCWTTGYIKATIRPAATTAK
jgi:hypothetical protein